MAGLSVKAVGKTPVVIGFVFVGVAHAVPEEEGVKPLGQERQHQAPDAVVDKVLVDLGAGGEAAAELGGKGHKGHAHDQRHFVFVYQDGSFCTHCSVPPLHCSLCILKLDHLAGIQDQLVVKGKLDGFVESDHPRTYKFF